MTDKGSATDVEDIEELIGRRFNDLSPRQQQAARYIVDNPEEVALRSMRAVAGRAGVDPSTMVRLAQDLGYSGYDELRECYRRKLVVGAGAGTWSGRLRRLRNRKEESSTTAVVSEILEQNQRNLEKTFSVETATAIETAKQLIGEARQFYIVGLRSMFSAAFYLHYACQMVNGKSVLLTGTGGTFADSLRYAVRDDVVLAFSCRPYASDAVRAVEFMKRLGARVIAVTDSKMSPIAKMADVVIIASNASTSLLPTVVPFMAIAEALAAIFVSEHGEAASEQIGRSEEQLLQFRVYQEDQPRRRPGSR